MKIKHIYTIAPLVGLLVFGIVYSHHRSVQKVEQAARQALVKTEQAARVAAQEESRRLAFADAIAHQEKRKAAKDALAKLEEAAKARREAAILARDDAFRAQGKIAKNVERLVREIAAEHESITRFQRDLDAANAESAFLRDYVATATAQRKALVNTLTHTVSLLAAPGVDGTAIVQAR
jgi:hypothetical protein